MSSFSSVIRFSKGVENRDVFIESKKTLQDAACMSLGGRKRGSACCLANLYAQIIHDKENWHIINSFLSAHFQTLNAALSGSLPCHPDFHIFHASWYSWSRQITIINNYNIPIGLMRWVFSILHYPVQHELQPISLPHTPLGTRIFESVPESHNWYKWQGHDLNPGNLLPESKCTLNYLQILLPASP